MDIWTMFPLGFFIGVLVSVTVVTVVWAIRDLNNRD